MASFLSPLLSGQPGPHVLINARTGKAVATELTTAFDSASRRTGLLKHETMPRSAALIIAPCSAVHTIGMRFAIDVVFVAKDGHVLKISHSLPRRRLAASLRAFAVVELAAGALGAGELRVGDQLRLDPSPSNSAPQTGR